MLCCTLRGLLAILVLSVIFVVSVPAPARVSAQEPLEVDWVEGPATAELGDVAEIELGEDYIFADAEDTRKLMEYLGNPPSDLEVGLVAPKEESKLWFVVFDYDPIGYVSDEEKDTLDSQAILESIKQTDEEANKWRTKRGMPTLTVIGWYEEPHYDVDSNNLVWATLFEVGDSQDGGQGVNYNTRLLGRHGYMAVCLVTDPATLDSDKPEVEDLIAHFLWKQGKSYTEWVPGDKVAEIGLTALAAGGAAAVLAKTGLLGKIWKFLVAGVIALVAAISGLIKRLRGKRKAFVSGDTVG